LLAQMMLAKMMLAKIMLAQMMLAQMMLAKQRWRALVGVRPDAPEYTSPTPRRFVPASGELSSSRQRNPDADQAYRLELRAQMARYRHLMLAAKPLWALHPTLICAAFACARPVLPTNRCPRLAAPVPSPTGLDLPTRQDQHGMIVWQATSSSNERPFGTHLRTAFARVYSRKRVSKTMGEQQ